MVNCMAVAAVPKDRAGDNCDLQLCVGNVHSQEMGEACLYGRHAEGFRDTSAAFQFREAEIKRAVPVTLALLLVRAGVSAKTAMICKPWHNVARQ